jgi:hypothetical protein
MRHIVVAFIGLCLTAPGVARAEIAQDDLPPRFQVTTPAVVQGLPGPPSPSRKDCEEEGEGESLRNGTLTGLVVGGVVGIVLAGTCGHPECGMLIGFSAGIGAAIGVAVDAIVPDRPRASPAVVRAKRRPVPFERGIAISVSKRW